MMRNQIDQNLRCRTDRLPLFLRLIDQRFGFSVEVLRLFDDRSCFTEKVDQRLGRWQGFLNLFKLWVAEAGNVADEAAATSATGLTVGCTFTVLPSWPRLPV